MWPAPAAVVLAGLAVAVAAPWAPASADDDGLALKAGANEIGWISLTVHGARRAPVEVRELTAGRSPTIARFSLRDGHAEIERAARWRCGMRVRRFAATIQGSRARTAIATITTPSCADRLRMIVVPARLRPGETVTVRVTDTWHFGGIAATVCARLGQRMHCKRERLHKGDRTRRVRLRLERPGPRTIVLRTRFGQRLSASLDVRDDAQLRVLVTGDSMILGMFQVLAGELGTRVAVHGDPRSGRGISTPAEFDWAAHAPRAARAANPDVTILFLGSADHGHPLVTPDGESVACCDPAWVAAYAHVVSEMTASYLRDGRGLVYWLLLPAPRSPARARVVRAENDAVRLAGTGFDDGVSVIGSVADILAPGGRYRDTATIDGRDQVVRTADGVHLAGAGILVATRVIRATLRRDDLLP